MPPPPRPRQAAPRAGRARWGCRSERRQNWCRAGRAARTYSPRPRWRPRPLHSCGSGPARCSRRLCLRGTGWRVRWAPPPASGRSSRPHHRSAALAKQTTGLRGVDRWAMLSGASECVGGRASLDVCACLTDDAVRQVSPRGAALRVGRVARQVRSGGGETRWRDQSRRIAVPRGVHVSRKCSGGV